MIRSVKDHFFKKIFSKLDFLRTVLVTIMANSEKMKMKKYILIILFQTKKLHKIMLHQRKF